MKTTKLLLTILAMTLSFGVKAGNHDRIALVSTIKDSYPKTNSHLAAKVVELSISLTKGTVFTPVDILSFISVESGFNPKARNSRSRGLMQVNGGSYDVETNMRQGVALLVDYHDQLGSKDAATKAYNVGISRYKATGAGGRYLSKVKAERKKFKHRTGKG